LKSQGLTPTAAKKKIGTAITGSRWKELLGMVVSDIPFKEKTDLEKYLNIKITVNE
jgi:hypothetical protein